MSLRLTNTNRRHPWCDLHSYITVPLHVCNPSGPDRTDPQPFGTRDIGYGAGLPAQHVLPYATQTPPARS